MKKNKWFLIKIFLIFILHNVAIYADTATISKPQTQVKQTEFTFDLAWARPALTTSSGSVAYLSITNNTNSNYNLISASAMSIANNVELANNYVDQKGIEQTSILQTILIPAQSKIEFKPGGMSIILYDLKKNLQTGDKFKLDLFFENLGKRTIEVEVKE